MSIGKSKTFLRLLTMVGLKKSFRCQSRKLKRATRKPRQIVISVATRSNLLSNNIRPFRDSKSVTTSFWSPLAIQTLNKQLKPRKRQMMPRKRRRKKLKSR